MIEKQTLQRVLIGGIIVNVLLVSVGVLFYFFLIQPTFISFANTSKGLVLLEERETFLQNSAREIEQRSNDLSTLNAAFLNLENAVPFVTLLETIAAESGVSISLQTAKASDPALTKQAEFTISLVGTLAAITQFIKQIELVPYFTDISSLHMSVRDTRVQATLNITVLAL